MSKIRVYELAKELNVSSKDLITLLAEEFSIVAKNHMSVIEDEDAELIKELLSGASSEASNDNDNEAKTIVDEYEEMVAEEVNNQSKKKKKGKGKRNEDLSASERS
ncbi:MAG: translation initiation factor IF-2 N-terminal domain-containing protein, partial [Clostridiaceae bacterium]